jgi:hypothetical protein
MTKRLILALLLSCSPLWATTYYVDNCLTVGNDLNNGTSTSTPWLTINKVNTSTFNPGDSILFESTCTWREQLTVPSSGSAGSPITFGAYGTGAAPIISGANLFTNWASSAGSLYYASYSTAPNQVFEDGARLTQNKVSAASLTAGQWYLDTVNSRIWVYTTAGDNPSGHKMEASQRGGVSTPNGTSYVTLSGIEVEKSNYDGFECGPPCTNLIITGMSFLYGFNSGLNILNGANSNIVVTYSTAAYNGVDGFQAANVSGLLYDHLIAHDNCWSSTQFTAGIKFNGTSGEGADSENGTVQYSVSYNNGVGGVNNIGAGIWADTEGGGFTAQYNMVYGNNEYGILIDAPSGTSTVAYNVAFNNGNAGVGQGYGIMMMEDWQTSMSGQKVYNNTAWGNYTAAIAWWGDSQTPGCTDNIMENNIAVNTTAGPNFVANGGCENSGTYGSGNVYTYNDFGPASSIFIQWGAGTFYSTYSAWETAAGNCGTTGCSHSVEAAPTFANASAGQFWLTSGSPGIGAGTNLGSPYNFGLMPRSTWPNSVVTGDQNAYGGGWEMGAFVYVPALAPPTNVQAVAH